METKSGPGATSWLKIGQSFAKVKDKKKKDKKDKKEKKREKKEKLK